MSAPIYDFSLLHATLYSRMLELARQESLFETKCRDAAGSFAEPLQNMTEAIDAAHRADRLIKVFTAGLENNQEFHAAWDRFKLSTWKDMEVLEVNAEIQQALGRKLYNVTHPESDRVLLDIGDKSQVVAEYIVERLVKENVSFNINFRDADFQNLLLNHCDEAGMNALADRYLENLDATKRIAAFPAMQETELVALTPEAIARKKIYDSRIEALRRKSMRGEILSTLTLLPTRKEAEIDRIPYKDYCRLFFEMCDQPWSRISDAHKILIEQFNRASHVRITNDWGTDIEMALVDETGRHFTFCNSLIAKNVPGSEIFSAPRRDSVNGQIVSYGRFHEDGKNIIENLRLHFTNGCLDTWAAEKGLEHFTAFVERDTGNRYVGELGIGTNPHLKQHVSNGLLVEKIGGSFHLALGNAYQMTDYLGEPVHVDNGNRSAKDHWDVTTMLYGAGGRIYLDGRLIMEDGYFLDTRLDVLNRGWHAVPEAERPEYWKSHVTPFGMDI